MLPPPQMRWGVAYTRGPIVSCVAYTRGPICYRTSMVSNTHLQLHLCMNVMTVPRGMPMIRMCYTFCTTNSVCRHASRKDIISIKGQVQARLSFLINSRYAALHQDTSLVFVHTPCLGGKSSKHRAFPPKTVSVSVSHVCTSSMEGGRHRGANCLLCVR